MSAEIKLGVSLYSYGADYLVTMTLEDCLADIADMGGSGVEILADTHIPGYPNPSAEWVSEWRRLLEKYGLEATCLSTWIDTRMRPDRGLTVEEGLAILRRDLELAGRLGFSLLRPKLGVISQDLMPDPIWVEVVKGALPDAERLGVRIAPEIHHPTPLKSKIVDDYLALAQETGTANFGILIDTGIFQSARLSRNDHSDAVYRFGSPDPAVAAEAGRVMGTPLNDDPAHMAEIMPYIFHIHAKFWDMDDDLQDPHIKWEGIVKTLVEGGYKDYLSSEYEGRRDLYRASDVVRRQHVMLRRLLNAGF